MRWHGVARAYEPTDTVSIFFAPLSFKWSSSLMNIEISLCRSLMNDDGLTDEQRTGNRTTTRADTVESSPTECDVEFINHR